MSAYNEPFTFEDITEIYRREKKSKYPVEVRPDFYHAIKEYRDRLKGEVEREFSIDRYSLKAKLASNQLIKFQETTQQVFEFRFSKIQAMGLRAALGNKIDLRKLTPEESEFFNLIVEIISSKKSILIGEENRSNRKSLDDIVKLASSNPAPQKEPSIVQAVEEELQDTDERLPELKEEFVPEEEVIGSEDTPILEPLDEEIVSEENKHSDAENFTLVRVLEEIPEIAAINRNFKLRKEDVVMLPTQIANILIKQKVAISIDATL